LKLIKFSKTPVSTVEYLQESVPEKVESLYCPKTRMSLNVVHLKSGPKLIRFGSPKVLIIDLSKSDLPTEGRPIIEIIMYLVYFSETS
jgi:hypothetical protein